MYGSILSYGRYCYLKLAAALAFLSLLLYLSTSSGEPPNGGTWQGYTLGGLSAALILILLWFGIRKRQYHRTETSVAAWASAHVYLGAALPVIASLHCGFQFGWNVHTLAYTLMALVVLSGFYGLYAYLAFPAAVTANRGGASRGEMIAAIARLDETGLALAEELGAEAQHQILRAVEETRFGGALWRRITGGAGLPLLPLLPWKPYAGLAAFAPIGVGVETASPQDFLHGYIRKTRTATEVHRVVELLRVLNERETLVQRVQCDIRYHTCMKVWLFLHVPLSCALLAATLVHVTSVFLYW